jgi:hypothetical protein
MKTTYEEIREKVTLIQSISKSLTTKLNTIEYDCRVMTLQTVLQEYLDLRNTCVTSPKTIGGYYNTKDSKI